MDFLAVPRVRERRRPVIIAHKVSSRDAKGDR